MDAPDLCLECGASWECEHRWDRTGWKTTDYGHARSEAEKQRVRNRDRFEGRVEPQKDGLTFPEWVSHGLKPGASTPVWTPGKPVLKTPVQAVTGFSAELDAAVMNMSRVFAEPIERIQKWTLALVDALNRTGRVSMTLGLPVESQNRAQRRAAARGKRAWTDPAVSRTREPTFHATNQRRDHHRVDLA